MKSLKVHKGVIVEKVVRRHNLSLTTISGRMNVDRRTLYNWFKRENLHNKIILQLGEILGYDFSADFQDLEILKDISTYKEPMYPITETSQYWMLKYLELLETYNAFAEMKTSDRVTALE
jgi:predicted transcriptional regulator